MKEGKIVFSVLAVNHPGVLLRVAGLFARRGFNIDSLVACRTENPAYSRLTLLVLVKVRAERDSRGTVLKAAQTYGARVLDIGDVTVTIEMTGQTDEMDRFVEHMESFGIREMARTGVTALERGDRTIHDEE